MTRGLLCSYFGVLNGMSSTVIAASTQLSWPSRHPSQPHPCPPCPSAEIGWTWRCGRREGINQGIPNKGQLLREKSSSKSWVNPVFNQNKLN